MRDFLHGCDVLGAGLIPTSVEPGGGPYVTIHFTNPEKLVRDKGGEVGASMFKIIPQTVLSQVYGQTRDKIEQGMKSEGADAEVKVVTQRPTGGPFGSDMLFGAAVGAGSVGAIVGIIKLVRHFTRR